MRHIKAWHLCSYYYIYTYFVLLSYSSLFSLEVNCLSLVWTFPRVCFCWCCHSTHFFSTPSLSQRLFFFSIIWFSAVYVDEKIGLWRTSACKIAIFLWFWTVEQKNKPCNHHKTLKSMNSWITKMPWKYHTKFYVRLSSHVGTEIIRWCAFHRFEMNSVYKL